MALRVHTSNRLEVLARSLAETLRAPLASPLATDIVVVHSRGMEQWLAQEIARHLGVCMNVRFPFPGAIVEELLTAACPSLPGPEEDPRVAAWRIYAALPDLLETPAFSDLRLYLAGDSTGRKRYELAGQIARVFRQYPVYRPDMILAWQRGEEGSGPERWQARLWRTLCGGGAAPTLAERLQAFFRLMAGPPGHREGFPGRLAVFGMSRLPPAFVQVFAAAAAVTDVHLFVLNPCREYWLEIRSGREIERVMERVREASDAEADPEDLYLTEGNRLLAAWGKAGRAVLQQVMQTVHAEEESFVDPGEKTLLAAIQRDILLLRDRTRAGEGPGFVQPEDRSLQVHACHGPLREIEVLHDQLLALFEADPDLRPGQILVMAPDMAAYAPLVDAVFGRIGEGDGQEIAIPYCIADRHEGTNQAILRAFLFLLRLDEDRFAASQILSLLDIPAVHRRFGLEEKDLPLIREWVAAVRIEWGRDGGHKARLGLPETTEHTWLAGLDRLLLACAMPDEGGLFAGILPGPDMEGDAARVLGRFVTFVQTLVSVANRLEGRRPARAWTRFGMDILEECFFFGGSEDAEETGRAIRSALAGLARTCAAAGVGEPLAPDAVRAFLSEALARQTTPAGFLGGGVTFCALQPMRTIPRDVICLVGMNGDAFPRQARPPDFDLLSRQPRPGDPSVRDDDRHLFLETLCAARKTLWISYCGQNIRDNSPRPPSVVVSELLEYVETSYVLAPPPPSPAGLPGDAPPASVPDDATAQALRERLMTVHRLQAFNAAYFRGDGRLFSYRADALAAARRLREGPPDRPRPFLETPLAGTNPGETVLLPDLLQFFRHPARWFLRRRLGIFFQDAEPRAYDAEPFELAGLDRYRLDEDLLAALQRGEAPEAFAARFQAAGLLPHGIQGKVQLAERVRLLRDLALQARRCAGHGQERSLPLRVPLSGTVLEGQLDRLYPAGQVLLHPGRIRWRHLLSAWIRHLCLLSGNPGDGAEATYLIGENGSWRFGTVEEPKALLEEYIGIYLKGFVDILPFFPETSGAYAESLSQGGRQEDALGRARGVWYGNDYQAGEGTDPWNQTCWRGRDPLAGAFSVLARAVYDPLPACRRDAPA